MPLSDERNQTQKQRVDVQPLDDNSGEVKITIERFDENLGWYTANSLRVPRQQLPILEQALKRVHRSSDPRKDGTVVPFEKTAR